jgi:hypothetical protein
MPDGSLTILGMNRAAWVTSQAIPSSARALGESWTAMYPT